MGHTLVEKIIMSHLNGKEVKPGDFVIVEPDFAAVNDIYASFLLDKMKEMGLKKVWNVDKCGIINDHLMPACLESDPRSLKAGYELVRDYGVQHLHATGGICHQLIPEMGYAKPGNILFVTDSHTTTYGALGCLSAGIGFTECAAIWGTGEIWLRVPETIKIEVEGKLPAHVHSKDIILKVLGDIGADGGRYKALEFCGSAIDDLSVEARMTIGNMTVECGGKCSMFNVDKKCAEYCNVDYDSVSWLHADADAKYERVIKYRAEDLVPVLACPPAVDNVHPITEVKGTRLDQVCIGSCTNGRFEDIEIAAKILKGKKVAPHVKFVITAATNSVMKRAISKGYIQDLVKAGAFITPPYCSFCEGRTMALLSADEVSLGTNNRNFLGRFGSPKAKVYLGSPEVAAVSAIAGEITDPRDLD